MCAAIIESGLCHVAGLGELFSAPSWHKNIARMPITKNVLFALTYQTSGVPRKERWIDMKMEDGGAIFSLIVYDHSLTLDELNFLQSLDAVEGVLLGNNTFRVIFKVDSFLDVTLAAVVSTQQALKKVLSEDRSIFLSGCLHYCA